MYKKSVQGWLKHLDFMILDVVCLWISFTLAFNMRHGSLDVLANSLYRDMMWSLALMDIVVIFFFDSLKNVLKRGFYQEFVMTVKQTCLITLCSVFYLFTFKEAENYSRLVLGYTAALYLLLSYVLRCLWKNCLRKYFGGAEKRSLLIVTVSDIVDLNIQNVIPMCCLLVFEVWLWTELHISTHLNIFWINALLCVAIILSSFKSLKYEGNLYNCGDDCRLTDRLQKNGRGKKKIYV